MNVPNPTLPPGRLPPTTEALLDDDTRPYFLWWTDTTVGQLKEHLVSADLEERAYWMGALLREANTRDVWLFVNAADIRALWPRLIRYLGRSRQMWAWLLQLPPPEWPPLSQIRAERRAQLEAPDGNQIEVDVVHELVADISAPPPPLEGIVIESLPDLRASKLTCILSRSEPRDLVDLYFLNQAGFPPERDLELALRKDAGVDPGVLAWLLTQFPTHPLPTMLEPLSSDQLQKFRDELAEKLRRSEVK